MTGDSAADPTGPAEGSRPGLFARLKPRRVIWLLGLALLGRVLPLVFVVMQVAAMLSSGSAAGQSAVAWLALAGAFAAQAAFVRVMAEDDNVTAWWARASVVAALVAAGVVVWYGFHNSPHRFL